MAWGRYPNLVCHVNNGHLIILQQERSIFHIRKHIQELRYYVKEAGLDVLVDSADIILMGQGTQEYNATTIAEKVNYLSKQIFNTGLELDIGIPLDVIKEALRAADERTVKYMVEEQQKEIAEQSKTIAKQSEQIAERDEQIAEQAEQLVREREENKRLREALSKQK